MGRIKLDGDYWAEGGGHGFKQGGLERPQKARQPWNTHLGKLGEFYGMRPPSRGNKKSWQVPEHPGGQFGWSQVN